MTQFKTESANTKMEVSDEFIRRKMEKSTSLLKMSDYADSQKEAVRPEKAKKWNDELKELLVDTLIC